MEKEELKNYIHWPDLHVQVTVQSAINYYILSLQKSYDIDFILFIGFV